MRPLLFIIILFALFIASGCQEEAPQAIRIPPQNGNAAFKATPTVAAQEETKPPSSPLKINEVTEKVQSEQTLSEPVQPESPKQPSEKKRKPPEPPIFEDFQGAPQLTLFPRVSDFRPEDGNERLADWKTLIENLIKVTGVAEDQVTGVRSWVFSSIDSSDSIGYFSPLAVEPLTTYQVSFKLSAELADKASAGISILEFDEFLWIPVQYTKEIFEKHYRGVHEGKLLTGTTTGEHTFSFTTGPKAGMIHVVLIHEGTSDSSSMMFDDIEIKGVSD